ncbi:hypothetical protein NL676_032441 [Syzygium grande]|nr:hypothetical protein NL676_032441 [Syzygium grande]
MLARVTGLPPKPPNRPVPRALPPGPGPGAVGPRLRHHDDAVRPAMPRREVGRKKCCDPPPPGQNLRISQATNL